MRFWCCKDYICFAEKIESTLVIIDHPILNQFRYENMKLIFVAGLILISTELSDYFITSNLETIYNTCSQEILDWFLPSGNVILLTDINSNFIRWTFLRFTFQFIPLLIIAFAFGVWPPGCRLRCTKR